LKITPEVLEGQKITTSLEAEVSDIDTSVGLSVPVGTQTIIVPGFSVSKANTEVTVASGETIMIAGLLKVEETHNVSQVPALGSIPVVGRLFRSPETTAKQRELIIAVTPELMLDTGLTTDKTVALEQALAVAEVTASVEDPTFRYALQVQDRIAKSLRYPLREKELGMGGQVKLRLHLFRDGSLGRALVAESSGIESLDLEALKAAETQSPYPPFPSDLLQQELWLELPVLFRS
jgi:TonB family protein